MCDTDQPIIVCSFYGGPWDTFSIEVDYDTLEFGQFIVKQVSFYYTSGYVYERIGETNSFLYTGRE